MGMKRSKRISALFLALVMCLSLFPTTAFADNDNTGEEVQQNTAEPVHEHSWSGWTVVTEATCSLVGLQQRSCACGATETAEIPAVPHNYGEWIVTKEATCTEAGEQQHVCAVCGGVENAAIPALPHDYGAWTVTEEPTCTEAGEQQHACTVCGVVETAAVPVEPHQFGAWTMTKEPTCTAAGEQQHACTVCGEVEKESIPVIPHSYGEWEVAREATCTKEGKQEHTCAVCGEVEKESIPVIPHNFGEWEVAREATCTREGKQEHTCSICGETEKEAIPVLEHTWGEDDVCSVCGAEREKKTYTVIWLTEDGKELEKDERVPEGVFPSFDGNAPVKDEDDEYIYEFAGWSPEPVSVTEDAVYTAQFTKTERRSDAIEKTIVVGNTLSVSVSAPAGAFSRGTEIRIAASGDVDVSSLAENAELVGAAELRFEKNGQAQTAESPVTVSVSMIAGRNEGGTYKAFRACGGSLTTGDCDSSFSVTEAAVFGVARIPAVPCTVTFDPANGEESIVISVEAGSAIGSENMPAVPVKTSCDFVKWVDAEDGTTEISAETVVTDNMAVSAEYKPRMPAASFQKGAGGVAVSVSAEEGTFPEGTVMTVVAVAASASLDTLSNVLDQEVAEARIVDITFWSEGKEIQPEKPVAVTLSVGAFVQEEDISVVHFSDNGGVSVVASGITGSDASFAAEHFSRYGVVVPAPKPLGEEGPFASNYNDLFDKDGNSIGFYISAQSGSETCAEASAHNIYYFMNEAILTRYDSTDINMVKRTAANDIGSASEFFFENLNPPVEGKYRIYTYGLDNNGNPVKKYLITYSDKKDVDFTSLDNATTFEISFKQEEGKNPEVTIRGNERTLNLKSKDGGFGFQALSDKEYKPEWRKDDGPFRLVLSSSIKNDLDPYNLDKKAYTIVFFGGSDVEPGNTGKAMSAQINNSKLKPQAVEVIEGEEGKLTFQTSGDDLVTWTFEAAGGGHYKLKTFIGNEWKYFQFNNNTTNIKLVGSADDATVLSVSPGTTWGKTSDGSPTGGKYRITWLPADNTKISATAIQVEDNFYGKRENSWAQSSSGQWLYLAQTSFTVIYYKDDGKTVFAEFTDKEYGDSIEIPSGPAKDADTKYTYTFDKWELVSGTALNGNKVAGDATYKATYTRTPQNYKVIYEVDGKQYKSETAAFKVEVTLITDPTKEGYTFSGWSSEDVTISEGKFTMPDHDVRIVGSFTGNPDSLTYDANGGTGTTAETKGKVGDTVKTAKNGFTRTGYKFQKWNTQADGKGTDYAENADYVLTAGADKLYAIWEADTNVVVTISAVQDTVLYDGAPHTVIGFLAQSNNAEYNKNIDDNFSYSAETPEVTGTNAGTYTVDLQAMVNSCKNENTKFANVTFRVNPNNRYDVLTITPRTVIMTSASDEKDYDGEALTNENVTITGDGFVGGQGAAYTFTGTQTEEGSSQNSFTYTLTGGALANNYNITTNFGTLTVHAAAGNEEIEDDETPKAETPEDIDENDTPMAIMKNWALLNLIAMILTVCTAAGMIITYFKKKDEDEGEDEEDGHSKGKFLGLIPGVGSVITFLLTEDVTTNMVMTDKWTVLMIAILAIGAALAWLTRNEKPEEEQPEGV